jgi:hypothetical protein
MRPYGNILLVKGVVNRYEGNVRGEDAPASE